MKPFFKSVKGYLIFAFVIIFLFLTLIIFFEKGSGSGINNYFDALWYLLVTLSTVGYGDLAPVTLGGRVVGLFFVILSLGIVGFLIGNISSKLNKYMENKKLGEFGTSFSDHIVIVGWDDFGKRVVDQVSITGHKVAIVTDNKDHIDAIRSLYDRKSVFVLYSDFANYENLKKVNLNSAAAVFLNFSNDTETLVYYLNTKAILNEKKCVVSLNNSDLRQTFRAAGVKYSVSKNDIASKLVASYIFEPDVATISEDLMSTAINEFDYDMLQYKVLEDNPYIGKTFMEVFVDMKTTYNSIVIGVSRFKKKLNDYQLVYNPRQTLKIGEGDYLIIIANGLAKSKVEKEFKVKEGRF